MTDDIKYYYLNMDTKQLAETENDLLEYFRNRSGSSERYITVLGLHGIGKAVVQAVGVKDFSDDDVLALFQQITKGISSGPSYKDRAIQEKRELDEKIAKLKEYLQRTARPDTEGNLLLDQLAHMMGYSDILEKRINRF